MRTHNWLLCCGSEMGSVATATQGTILTGVLRENLRIVVPFLNHLKAVYSKHVYVSSWAFVSSLRMLGT